MPNVPRRSLDEVNLTGLPSVRGNTDTPAGFSGGGPAAGALAQANTGLAKSVIDVIAEQKKQADQTAVLDASAKMTALTTSTLYGENGYLSSQGKDALGTSYDAAQKQYSDEIEKIRKGLNGNVQQAEFARIERENSLHRERSMQSHMATQAKAYNLATGMALVNSSTQAGVEAELKGDRTPDNFGRTPLQKNLDQINRGIELVGETQGLPKEAVDILKLKATSDLHDQVIHGFISARNPEAAEAYFKKNRGGIEAKDQDNLETLTKTAVYENHISNIAAKSINQGPETLNADGTVNKNAAIQATLADEKIKGYDQQQTDGAIRATINKANMYDAQLAERKNAQVQAFYQRTSELTKGKAPYEAVHHQIFDVENLAAGMSPVERDKLEKDLVNAYANKDKYHSELIARSGEKTSAWKLVESIVKNKYLDKNATIKVPGTDADVNQQEYALMQMKRQLQGIPVAKWTEYATDQTKDVPVPVKWWFDSSRPKLEQTQEQNAKTEREAIWSLNPKTGQLENIAGLVWKTRKDGTRVRVRPLLDGNFEVVP